MRKKATVTLTDVAKVAGVSQSTVSRALNKHPRINKSTRNRVFDIIREMGYDTSSIERKALVRTAKANSKAISIQVLLCPLPEQKNMLGIRYFSDVFNGIHFIFNQIPYVNHNLRTWQVGDEFAEHNEQVFESLLDSDGVVILGNPDDNLLERIVKSKIKAVLVATGGGECPIDIVGSDNIEGGMLAARYLMDHGYKNIGYLDGPDKIHEWQSRKKGARVEVSERLGDDHFKTRKLQSTELVEVIRVFREWVDSGEFPDAVILPYSDAVIGLEIVLTEKGMKCPEDVGLVAFSYMNHETFHIKPVILDVFPHLIGKKAAQRLIQIIEQPNFEELPHRIVVPMKLIEGNSVKE